MSGSSGAIADVITMLEGVRAEIAAEQEAVNSRIAEILAEAQRRTAALYVDGKDLETRDRMLVSAIATLHDVAARGRKAVAAAAEDPLPEPSPARGEGEEGAAAAVSDCAIDAVAGAVAGEGESVAMRLPGEPVATPVDILERVREIFAASNEGREPAELAPAPAEDVDGRDAPGHDGGDEGGEAGIPAAASSEEDEGAALPGDPAPRLSPARGEGEEALSPDERTVRAAAAALAEQDAQRPSNCDVSAVDKPYPEAGPQAKASHAGIGTGLPASREGNSREGAANPAEAEAAASGTAAPVARAYQGVGVKAPARGAAVAGEVVQVPLVDDKPAQPAESAYIAEGQRLADQIHSDLPVLMELFPQGPTVGQLAEYYQAPSSRVRDALNRLKEQRRAVVHKAKKTGFLHLMPLGSRP